MKVIAALSLTLAMIAPAALAVPFGTWTEQRFPRLPANQWTQSARGVDVLADMSVSLIWTRLPVSDGATTRASWDWSVSRSVPATDLARKGGDDRNLALYFVFMPPNLAETSREAGVRQLLRARESRVLTYVWGGAHSRGEILPSPYLGDRGRTIVLQPAGTGAFRESVDLEADYARAFGDARTVLVGLAVSADSDDTETSVEAMLRGLRLE